MHSPFKKSHFGVLSKGAACTEFSTFISAAFLYRWNKRESEGCSEPVLDSDHSWISKNLLCHLGYSLRPAANLLNAFELPFLHLYHGRTMGYLAWFGEDN